MQGLSCYTQPNKKMTKEEQLAHNLKLLPEACFCAPGCMKPAPNAKAPLIKIIRGSMGYSRADHISHMGEASEDAATRLNKELGVSVQQEIAMLTGSMFGFHTAGANPENYNESGDCIL